MQQLQCLECGTDDIQRVELAYLSGTSNINMVSKGRSVGVGVSRAGGNTGLGAGVAGTKMKTTGTDQSMLAESLTPPSKKSIFWTIIFILIGWPSAVMGLAVLVVDGDVVGMFFLIFGLVFFGAGVYGTYTFHQYNTKIFPIEFRNWQQSWLCKRCGSTFLLNV